MNVPEGYKRTIGWGFLFSAPPLVHPGRATLRSTLHCGQCQEGTRAPRQHRGNMQPGLFAKQGYPKIPTLESGDPPLGKVGKRGTKRREWDLETGLEVREQARHSGGQATVWGRETQHPRHRPPNRPRSRVKYVDRVGFKDNLIHVVVRRRVRSTCVLEGDMPNLTGVQEGEKTHYSKEPAGSETRCSMN